MRRLALAGALVLAAAAVLAGGAAVPRRERSPAEARLPSAGNPAPRGLGAAAAWLAATGRSARVLDGAGPPPGPAEGWLLVAPAAPLPAAEAQAFLDHAARGGLAVWAMGATPQPSLERALGTARVAAAGERTTAGLPGASLLAGLALRVGGAGVTSSAPGARAATGPEEPPAAVSVPVGRGEVLVLASPDLLDNGHLAEGDTLSAWVRLAARGPLVFDERWLAPPAGGAALRRPALAAAQALLAGLALLLALGRRHGAIRPPAPPAARLTARDYLASLAALSRRAGAERELAEASWRRLRRALEREGGVPARLPGEEAARRLVGRSTVAADALRRGEAALAGAGRGQLLAVTQAAADLEGALRRPRAPQPAFDSPPAGR